MVGALIGASEAEPLVVGKPSSFLLDTICRASGLSRPQICVVGDRLDTDVLWGNKNGCGTLLVLSGARLSVKSRRTSCIDAGCLIGSGVTSEALLKSPGNKIFPTHYIDSVGDLLTIKDRLSYCVIS